MKENIQGLSCEMQLSCEAKEIWERVAGFSEEELLAEWSRLRRNPHQDEELRQAVLQRVASFNGLKWRSG